MTQSEDEASASDPALAEATILVAGGAGEVGEGVVRVLLSAGATVIAPSRSAEKINGLQRAMSGVGSGRLIAPELDVSSERGLTALAQIVEEEGRLSAVVSSIGGFWQGPPLVSVEPQVFRDGLEERVFPHLRLIQAMAPRLADGRGAFVHLSGLVALLGLPGLSALGVSTAAQLAVTRAFLAEAGEHGPRVFALVIEQFVKTRSRQELPPGALTADEVGAIVRELILGGRKGAMLALRKVEGQVETEPLPSPVNPASVQRLTRALMGP